MDHGAVKSYFLRTLKQRCQALARKLCQIGLENHGGLAFSLNAHSVFKICPPLRQGPDVKICQTENESRHNMPMGFEKCQGFFLRKLAFKDLLRQHFSQALLLSLVHTTGRKSCIRGPNYNKTSIKIGMPMN